LLWSLTLSGSCAFPVIVLSIWWKRANAWGALAGLSVGFTLAVVAILTGEVASVGLPGATAAVVAAPAALMAMLVVSLVTPAPGRQVLELVRELRIPGGETFYDRETRLALLRQQQQRS
jgi:cation/acetate symporter